MSSGAIIGLLALFTIGGTAVAAVLHFGYFLRDPRNREAAAQVANDRESATTRQASNEGTPNKPLLQRLKESEASTKR